MNLSFFQISIATTAIASFALGIFVFLSSRRSRVHQFWLLSTFFIALWSIGFLGVISATTETQALFWQSILDIGGILIPVGFFNFVLCFLGLKYKKQAIFAWLFGLAIAIFSFSDLFKKGVLPRFDFNYWVDSGPFYFVFPLFLFCLILYSVFLLLKTYRETEKKTFKVQIGYVLLAVIFGFGGGITNFFPQLFNIYPLGNYFVILYVIFISYAILKYHLFDIKLIATELLIGLVALVLLTDALTGESLLECLFKLLILFIFLYLGIGLIRSVMREIQQREELQQAYAKLKELDEAKSEFISIASHQLRTPLTAIKGYLSMMLDGTYGKLESKQSKTVESVYDSNERLIRLVNDLLNVSRIESGRMEMDWGQVDLEELARSVLDELKVKAEEKGIELKLEEEPSFPDIEGDKEKLRNVILNLVDNAIRYTDEGSITVSTRKLGDSVFLRVRDTGAGMMQKEIGTLFQSFSRGTAGERRWTEGAGLGLYIAKQFVHMHKGEIRAESAGKGKGSTFSFKVPIAREIHEASQR